MTLVNILRSQEFNRLLIVGPSGSGKTTLVKHLLSRIDYESLYIFGENVLNRNSPYLPYSQHFTVTDVLDFRDLRRWIAEMGDIPGKKYLVMDDIIPYKLHQGKNRDQIEAIFSSCRHQGVSIIAICHSYKSLPPTCRQQYTELVICRLNVDIFKHFIKDYICLDKPMSDSEIISVLRTERFQYLLFLPNEVPQKQIKKFKLKV